MKLQRVLSGVSLFTGVLWGQTATDPNSGLTVSLDTSTSPATGQARWWGDGSYHYLLEYTLEMGEPWLSVPGVNPHGENAILEAPFALPESGDRIFFRLLSFGPDTISQFADSDSDSLPDPWEIFHFGDLTSANGTLDYDGDNLINSDEFQKGTSPINRDTDGDGLLDGNEVWLVGTNPTLADTDADGMPDGWE